MTTHREIQRLEAQLRLSFEGEAWHGPSVLEALVGVSAEDAHAHPIPDAHSIWELVLHLSGSYRIVLRRVDGDAAQLSAEEDWPAVQEPTSANWRSAVDALRELNSRIRRAVLAFDPDRLDEPLVAEPPYTAFTQFIGITQHDLYHAGQIVMLKRLLERRRAGNVTQAVPFFGITDIDASLRFYVDGLGFTMKTQWAPEGRIRWCWLERGSAAVMLQEFWKNGQPGEAPAGPLAQGVSVCFMCIDAIAIYHEAKARGLAPATPYVGNGLWVTSFTDPDGYRLDFESPTDVAEDTVYSEPT